MRNALRGVGVNLRSRRYIDVYAAASVSIILAVLSIVTDSVPGNLRWAALLAGVSILGLRITVPESAMSLEAVLGDRFAFDREPIGDRLHNADEVWIFAPSAINILSGRNCELLRRGPLSKTGGTVRVVVLDSKETAAVDLATRQLDYSLDYPTQSFPESLETTTRLLSVMSSWRVAGSFEFRVLAYNPGFSLVALNPGSRNGVLIVELHGFHNESTSSRMHVVIERQHSRHWYDYWVAQFGHIWEAANGSVESISVKDV